MLLILLLTVYGTEWYIFRWCAIKKLLSHTRLHCNFFDWAVVLLADFLMHLYCGEEDILLSKDFTEHVSDRLLQ